MSILQKAIAAAALIVALAACQPTPVNTTNSDAGELVNSFVYVKAANGLCFGVTTVSRVNSGGQYSLATPVINVPCATVGL